VIKEGDLDLIRDDLVEFTVKPRMPARVVLNNQTLTIFETSHTKDVILSVLLPNIIVVNSKNTNCIDIIDKKTHVQETLCSMGMLGSDHEQDIAHWKEEIKFFAEKCYKKLPIVAVNKNIISLRQKELEAAEAEMKQNANVLSTNLNDQMSDVTNLAVDAITKEMKFESFAEQEELQRENSLENKGRTEVEEVKYKMECLKRLERQSDARGQADIEQVNIKGKIDALKVQIRDMIENMRKKQQSKISIMQLIADKKYKEQKNEASQLKIKMAAQLLQAYEKGDKEQCAKSDEPALIDAYCNKQFPDQPQLNQGCKVTEDFCFICCDKEFGSMRMTERKDCYQQCAGPSDY